MSGPIHLYVSSSSELVAEREAIGQVVAALPMVVGWQISHTPQSGAPDGLLGIDKIGMLIHDCDLYALVLGQDLTAPMGFEVRSALGSAHLLGAYRKKCSHSPSAQDAVRTLDLAWKRYSDPAAFGKQFRHDLLRRSWMWGRHLGLTWQTSRVYSGTLSLKG